jgi:ribosomal protein L37AE/L43A
MTGNQRRTCSSCGWKTKNGAVVEREDGVRVWRCSSCAKTEAFITKVAATPVVPHGQAARRP